MHPAGLVRLLVCLRTEYQSNSESSPSIKTRSLHTIFAGTNLTANSNEVGNTVQGLTKKLLLIKAFQETIARTCPKNSKWFEFLGQVTGTKVWSLPLDFKAKMTSSHDESCTCNL